MPFSFNPEYSLQKPANAHQELMNFFNAMDEVFFSVEQEGRKVIQISNGCEKLYGHKPEEFLANSSLWFELIHPDDKEIVAGENEMLLRGETVSKEYRIVRKDNTIRWVENKVVPGFDDKGKLVRIDGITRDITERKQADELYRERDAWSRQIVETAQEGIWTIDENDKTNFVNQKLGDILGYDPKEMIGKEPALFIDQTERHAANERIQNRKRGLKQNVDAVFLSKAGEQVWLNLSANPIFDEAGTYKGSLGMMTDITQRKKDEEALRKSEANLRAIFDNTDSSYILIGPDLKIISFNALAQKFSRENNAKDLEINKDISCYFSPERWSFIRETLDNVARNGTTESYELSYPKPDGTLRWNNVRWLNVRNSDQGHLGFILANKDITEMKTAMLERERVTADLIQHIKDLEQFTYIISHNLRAPVANIIGLSEMLREDMLDPDDKKEVVERVSQSIKNIDGVIQDLNDILRARELVNEKKDEIYFIDLVNTIKTSIFNTITSEKVQFECTFNIASMFTVKSYLYSIFYNLVSNSIKYRQPGAPPLISIESRKVKDKIELRFNDNGKGIDLDKNAAQIFGLYKRFDTTMEGKGMGLFMVKTQVEALGGSIKIKSKLNHGTEFIIQFSA